MKFLARLLAPYLWDEIQPYLEEQVRLWTEDTLKNYAYSVVAARHSTEVLAEALGYTVVIDNETGEAVVEKI